MPGEGVAGCPALMDYVIVREFAVRRRRDRTEQHKAAAAAQAADERARQYATALLTQAREELVRVDSKASIMLAAVGVTLGVVVGDLVSRGWSPFRLAAGPAVVWWVGVAAVITGTLSLLAAVYPRRRQHTAAAAAGLNGFLGYYADVAGYGSTADVIDAIRRSAERELELMAEQILQISRIVDRKYRLLGWGVWLLIAGVACGGSALLINAS